MDRKYGGVILGLVFWTVTQSYGQEIFQVSPPLQEKLRLESYQGFLLLENSEEAWDSNYSVISNFEEGVLESQILLGAKNFQAAQAFIDENLRSHDYKGVDVRELSIPLRNGKRVSLFWVGHRAYPNLSDAQGAIDTALAGGISPQDMAVEVGIHERSEETAPEVQSETEGGTEVGEAPAQEKSQYPFALDQKIKQVPIPGTKVEPEESRFDWQTFGEFSWRRTNFDSPNNQNDPDYFDSIVGFQTLRVIMKGIRFYEGGPSLDPYVEGTFSLGSNATPFESKFVGAVGVEYYLLAGWHSLKQNAWLEWITNLRLFGQYMDLYHLRDEDTAVPTYDWRAGMGLYKDWGWGKPFDEQERFHFSDYLWGELFLENVWKKTDFNREDYNSMTWTDVAWIGIKFPWIDGIPPLMPYAKVEFTATQRDLFFQNRPFVGFGVRYMPFHTGRFQNHEWLYNFKIFAEYDQVIDYLKDEPTDDRPDWDFRFGIKIDINRF